MLIDGAQGAVHLDIDVRDIGCDFYVFSGHKVFAPTGIGAVFMTREAQESLPPWQGGGNMIRDVTFAHDRHVEARATALEQPPQDVVSPEARGEPDRFYRVGPGDRLRINVFGEPGLENVPVAIEADGSAADLPLRLGELGFLPGERVRVLVRAPLGGPLAVRIGSGTFGISARRFVPVTARARMLPDCRCACGPGMESKRSCTSPSFSAMPRMLTGPSERNR